MDNLLKKMIFFYFKFLYIDPKAWLLSSISSNSRKILNLFFSVFWHHTIEKMFCIQRKSLTRKMRMALQLCFTFRKYILVSSKFISSVQLLSCSGRYSTPVLFFETKKMNGKIIWSGSKTPNLLKLTKIGMSWIVTGYLTGARHLLGQVRYTSIYLHIV